MSSIGEYFYLFWLKIKVLFFDLWEERLVRKQFYSHDLFPLVDRALKKAYAKRSAFAISKQFMLQRGEDNIHCYGETPLTSLKQIATIAGIDATDHVFELGCGRGRLAFFLSSVLGSKVTAIDYNPYFIHKAKQTLQKAPSLPVTFLLSDITEVNFEGATVIYLCGTCMSDELISALSLQLSSLKNDVKIISVSFPLTDYRPAEFKVIDHHTVPFNWGRADVFIQKVEKPASH